MEKFKFKKDNLLNICRELKDDIKVNLKQFGYCEKAIIYNVDTEEFFICDTQYVQREEYKGNIYYDMVVYNQQDEKPTIKNLMLNVFKRKY